MTHSDPIADMITRIRNAYLRKKSALSMPHSKIKEDIAKVLKRFQFIEEYKVTKDNYGTLNIALKYFDGRPAVIGIVRESKPGRRKYVATKSHFDPSKKNVLTVISTSKGVMATGDADKLGIGGELLISVW